MGKRAWLSMSAKHPLALSNNSWEPGPVPLPIRLGGLLSLHLLMLQQGLCCCNLQLGGASKNATTLQHYVPWANLKAASGELPWRIRARMLAVTTCACLVV